MVLGTFLGAKGAPAVLVGFVEPYRVADSVVEAVGSEPSYQVSGFSVRPLPVIILHGIRFKELRGDVCHFVLPALDPVLGYLGVREFVSANQVFDEKGRACEQIDVPGSRGGVKAEHSAKVRGLDFVERLEVRVREFVPYHVYAV